MRTTLTLDSDVARELQARVRKRKLTFKEVVNTALRTGLALDAPVKSRKPFRVQPHPGGFGPGTDPHLMNRIADELEDTAAIARIRRS
jgi:hypothetical protein